MITVVPTAIDASHIDFSDSVAVVIDVLRATTTMTVAIHNGATQVIAVSTPQQAFDYKLLSPHPDNILLGGERNADIIPGFNLDNSPRAYTTDVVAGKTIVMTTTNGTQAIVACHEARLLLIASFPNANAIISLLHKSLSDNPLTPVFLVCSGTEGCFTLEDGLCAGYIANHLDGPKTDFTLAMEQLYLSTSNDIKIAAQRGEHFSRLKRKGYEGDINVCFDLSSQFEALHCVNGVITRYCNNNPLSHENIH